MDSVAPESLVELVDAELRAIESGREAHAALDRLTRKLADEVGDMCTVSMLRGGARGSQSVSDRAPRPAGRAAPQSARPAWIVASTPRHLARGQDGPPAGGRLDQRPAAALLHEQRDRAVPGRLRHCRAGAGADARRRRRARLPRPGAHRARRGYPQSAEVGVQHLGRRARPGADLERATAGQQPHPAASPAPSASPASAPGSPRSYGAATPRRSMRAANPAATAPTPPASMSQNADARGCLGAVVVAADQPLVVDVGQVGEAPDAERHEPGHHQGGRSRAAAAPTAPQPIASTSRPSATSA